MTSPQPARIPAAESSRPARALVLAATVAGLATRLPFVAADEGWFDEHFSILTAGLSVPDILREALREQSNPPGFYLLAHVWGLLGGSGVPWHRLLPAISGALVPAVLVLAALRLGLSRWTAALAGVLAVAAPFLWQMSLEIRAYAPLALLTALALCVAARMAQDANAPSRRSVVGLASLHVAMVMLHYFAALSVLGIALAVAASAGPRRGASKREALSLMLALGLPAALAMGSWLAIAFLSFDGMSGRNIAWIPNTGVLQALQSIPELVLAPIGPIGRLMSGALLLGGAAAALLWATRPLEAGAERRVTGRFVLLACALPVLLALALHIASGKDLWVPRYLTGFLPGLALMAAMVADAVPIRARRVLAVSAALWWAVAGGFYFAGRWPKPDWTRIMAALAPDGRATLCTTGSFVGLPFIFHARALELDGIRVIGAARCRADAGLTWLVYDVDRTGMTPAPRIPGVILGPRIVLFRGMQSMDARRVLNADASVPP
jgi:uncharacterized membrane protein